VVIEATVAAVVTWHDSGDTPNSIIISVRCIISVLFF
jgi:hypothetical protein